MRSLAILTLLCVSLTAFGSNEIPRNARKAEDFFIEYDYFEALDAFKEALEKHDNHPFILRRIADCYRLMGVPSEAKEWYKRSIDFGPKDPLDYYYCSEVHRSLGEYEAANYYMAQYSTSVPDDTRARRVKSNGEYYKQLEIDQHQYLVDNFEVNNQRAVLPPTEAEELLILPIASDVNEGWYPHKRFLMDYDLYQTTVDEKFNLVSAEPLRGEVNTKFLEGPSTYDKERGILYVTRFLSRKEKPGIDELGHVYSMIQSYTLQEGYWMEANAFPHNSDNTSCAYPAISADGETLVFSSNQKGGMGAMDLYTCTWQEELQQWGEPKPMSSDINTEGNEIYPNFAPDGTFSFASDGHPTLGGLDIFFADISAENIDVVNPGIPVNSRSDDFGLVYMGDEYGYFCSDRTTDIGGDDLFWWEEMHEIIEAEIVLMDKTGNPLYPDKVTIKNIRTDEQKVKSGMRGSFKAEFNGKDTYEIAWMQDDQTLLMHCTPEVTPYGLRYTYDTPNKSEFVADAEVESYKEGSFRKKKVPFKSWNALNLTNQVEYPANESDAPKHFMMAEWSPTDANRPPTNSRVYIKDMETGKVQAFQASEVAAEFEIIPEHMHAMMWRDHNDQMVTRYVQGDLNEEGETAMRFVGISEDWAMALNSEPVMDMNKEGDKMLVAALMASTEGGMVEVEDAGELLLYAEDGREITVESSMTRVHAEDVYFAFDRFNMIATEAAKLKDIADQMARFTDAKIEIVAHTDSRGSKTYNKRLSRLRAERTKKALLKLGVPEDRITIEWKGEESLVNDCFDGVECSPNQHRLNRRAEVHLLLPGKFMPG